MKKLLLLPVIFIVTSSASLYPQDDSAYYSRLYYTCKAWGFVKYFHSELAECSMNWDSVLVAKIPEIKEAANNAGFNDLLLEMISAPGETAIPTSPAPVIPDSLCYNLKTDWFDDEALSEEVRSALDTLFVRFRPGPHCMVGQAFYNGNPTFDNDNQYHTSSGLYPAEELRLLALFRYWNIINYFSPYKYIMDQNWDTTLVEMIPFFCEASDATDYDLAMFKIAKRLNDSHAYTGGGNINAILGNYYPNFAFGFFEDETVIYKVDNSIPELQPGDIVRSLDGFDIEYLRDSIEQYTRGSNDLSIQFYVHDYMLRNNYGSFDITVENASGLQTHTLARNWSGMSFNNFLANTGPIWYDTLINNTCLLGYVDMSRLTTGQVETMMEDLGETDAIIFDIRNYPQGTLWTLVNYLFHEPIHIASFTRPVIHHPGVLAWMDATIGSYNLEVYEGQLIILFDNRTISQAEYTVMGLEQHPGAIKIGSTTKAADGNVSKIFLPGSIFTYFTGLGTFYPDYTPTQRVGIIPDVYVWQTIQGFIEGRDEVLEYAMDCALVTQRVTKDPGPAAVISANPNPFRESTVLSYSLGNPGSSRVEVIDLSGQKVLDMETGIQTAGPHAVVIEAKTLKPGIYFCVLKNSDGKRAVKIVKSN